MADGKGNDIFDAMRSAARKLEGTDDNQPKQRDIFDAMRSAARKVDVKTVEEEIGVENRGVDVDTILDSHYTVDRHKVEARICQSCSNWIKPGCCRLTADYAYGVVSYRATRWSDTCNHYMKIIMRSFPESKPKQKRRNSYTKYKYDRH